MLYLKHTGDDAASEARWRLPLAERTTELLERTLLASDSASRRNALNEALAADSVLSGWALRLAERRTARTINQVDQAADWLCSHLESELAGALELDPGVEPSSVDQLRLVSLVTRLAEYESKLKDFDRKLEREKLESLKELAYGASHEINNPLANIAARAQTLLVEETDPERARKLTAIHRQAMRAHEMISDLMLFARPPKLVPQPLDIRQLVHQIADEYRELAHSREIEITCDVGHEPVEALADETQLGVAVSALVRNSLEALAGGGHIWIATRRAESDGLHSAEISVRDDGPGIADAVRRHMFDPFFSGREAGRGLGFGLSKCWRIVSDHGGQIVVNSDAGGAEFRIQLPLQPPALDPSAHK